MAHNQRKYEPFSDEELVDIRFARDEMSAQMNQLMIEEDKKYERRVAHSKKALAKESFIERIRLLS